jgi:hypothetical protein
MLRQEILLVGNQTEVVLRQRRNYSVLANCLRNGVGEGFSPFTIASKRRFNSRSLSSSMHFQVRGKYGQRIGRMMDQPISQRTWIWRRSTSVQALEEILVFHALQQREIDKFRHLFPLEMRKTVTQVLDIVL